MKSPSRMLRQFAAGAAMLAATAGAQAVTFDLLLTGNGIFTATPCDDMADCVDIGALGLVDDFDGLESSIPDSWAFFETNRLIGGLGSGTWEFQDLGDAGNDLFGTSTSTFTQLSPTLGKVELMYTIGGGAGMFAGASGSGFVTAFGDLVDGTYVSSGSLSVTPIPEPETWALMFAGLAAVGAAVRRRRTS